MGRNLGGRPRHHGEETKKAAIAVRTAPSIHTALRSAAEENGRSITQEVEARLIVSFDRDAGLRSTHTELLLNRIAGEIADLESFTRKRWHRDRATAAALKKLLSDEVPAWIKVDEPLDDLYVSKPLEQMLDSIERYEALVEQLQQRGITAQPRSAVRSLVKEVPPPTEFRSFEREQVASLEISEEEKTAALAVIDEIEALDIQIEAERIRFSSSAAPYRKAAEDGRALYAKWREEQR